MRIFYYNNGVQEINTDRLDIHSQKYLISITISGIRIKSLLTNNEIPVLYDEYNNIIIDKNLDLS